MKMKETQQTQNLQYNDLLAKALASALMMKVGITKQNHEQCRYYDGISEKGAKEFGEILQKLIDLKDNPHGYYLLTLKDVPRFIQCQQYEKDERYFHIPIAWHKGAKVEPYGPIHQDGKIAVRLHPYDCYCSIFTDEVEEEIDYTKIPKYPFGQKEKALNAMHNDDMCEARYLGQY